MTSTSTKHLRLAIIGAGHWGPNLIRNFSENSNCEVIFVSDLDPQRLQLIQERFPKIQVTPSAEQAITHPSVDAVVICSPTVTHYSLTRLALESGKHVFVEKPIATSYAESLELVALSSKVDRKLMVGHIFLFNPAVQTIKRLLDEEALGSICYLHATRTNLGPIRADVDALWDLAPHDISVMLYLLGKMPEKVSGTGASFINPPVDDVAFASLRFSESVIANLHVSWLDPKKVRNLVIVGTKKMLVFDDMTPSEPIRLFDKSVSQNLSQSTINDTIHLFRKSIFEGQVTVPELETGEPLKNECQAFVDWVLNNRSQPSTGLLGAQVVQVLEKITEAIKTRREVAIPGYQPAESLAKLSSSVAPEL